MATVEPEIVAGPLTTVYVTAPFEADVALTPSGAAPNVCVAIGVKVRVGVITVVPVVPVPPPGVEPAAAFISPHPPPHPDKVKRPDASVKTARTTRNRSREVAFISVTP
jgi:hypothetical protein